MRAVLMEAAQEMNPRRTPTGFLVAIDRLTRHKLKKRENTSVELKSHCDHTQSEVIHDDGPRLDYQAMKILSRAVSMCTKIQSVTLYCCGIDDDGAEMLFRMLRGNKSIMDLNLGWNRIGPGGHRALIAMLPYNKILAKVNLNENYAQSLDITTGVCFVEISDCVEEEMKVAVSKRETPIVISFLCRAIGPGNEYRMW